MNMKSTKGTCDVKSVSLTVKMVPHPEPQRVIDLMARIVLDEILKQEQMIAESSA